MPIYGHLTGGCVRVFRHWYAYVDGIMDLGRQWLPVALLECQMGVRWVSYGCLMGVPYNEPWPSSAPLARWGGLCQCTMGGCMHNWHMWISDLGRPRLYLQLAWMCRHCPSLLMPLSDQTGVRWMPDGCSMGVRWVSDGCPMGARWVSEVCPMSVRCIS